MASHLAHSSQARNESSIVNVWAGNFEAAMQELIMVVEDYPVVAMDTEFPGVVIRPIGSFKDSCTYRYSTLKCNVDILKLIQLGLTFFDREGRPRPGRCTFQFNFLFDVENDMHAHDSIALLENAGLNFESHQQHGIDTRLFAEALITSGLVLDDEITWLSFHSGYDFGYLLRLLTAKDLPAEDTEFFSQLKIWFPVLYDLKYMMKSCETLNGGLDQLANDLGVARIGTAHTAGSDSWVTGDAFFRLKARFFENSVDKEKYSGAIYGLGVHTPAGGRS